MHYQLVLQFTGGSLADYDRMIALEDQLTATLGKSADVDGHDCGQGETNIFILTNDPASTFQHVRSLLSEADYSSLRVAYRRTNRDKYTVIWPMDFAGTFTIQ